MNRAFSTLGCIERTWPEIVALARKHGINALELRGLNGGLNLAEELTRTFGEPAGLARAAAEAGLRIVVLDTSFRLMAPAADPAELAALGPWAAALGGVPLRVFDGGRDGGAEDLARARTVARDWAEQCDRHGWEVELWVETHDALTDGAAIRRFGEATEGALPILWESWHTWAKGGEPPSATWAQIANRVRHVHVKDGWAGMGADGRPRFAVPGAGAFPMAELRQVLSAGGYEGHVCLEWPRHWRPELAPLDEVLTAAGEEGWW